MKEYTPFFSLCDECSKCLLQINNWIIIPERVPKDFPGDADTSFATWKAVFHQLYSDGYITQALDDGDGVKYYILSTKGRVFLEKGGYAYMFAEQAVLHELELQMKGSIVDTNEAVQKNFKSQDKMNFRMFGIAALAALFSLITMVKELWPKPELKLPDLEEQLKQQTKAIQGIELSLKAKPQEVLIKDSVRISKSK